MAPADLADDESQTTASSSRSHDSHRSLPEPEPLSPGARWGPISPSSAHASAAAKPAVTTGEAATATVTTTTTTTTTTTGAPRRPFPPTNALFRKPSFGGPKKYTRTARKATKSSLQSYAGWEQPQARRPYHAYVHQLVDAGWDNLRGLDAHLQTDVEDRDLVISVLDVTAGQQLVRWPDLYDAPALDGFLRHGPPPPHVRLVMIEQEGPPAASIIEVLGRGLNLDPRFFQWAVHGSKGLFTPSQMDWVDFAGVGFGVLATDASDGTVRTQRFHAMIYVLPDPTTGGWTGIFLFNSHARIRASCRSLKSPPRFDEPMLDPPGTAAKTLRELYLETFDFVRLDAVLAVPFCAVEYLLRLNYLCWNEVITRTREEDRRIRGVSDYSVGHGEDIQKSLRLIDRGGTKRWKGGRQRCAIDLQQSLREDFESLMEQSNMLWETRRRWQTLRQQRRDARSTALTNAFTYVFAPITLMTGVYGMNVAEINGSPLSVWQPFVAAVALNVLVFSLFASWNGLVTRFQRKQPWDVKQALGFAAGYVTGQLRHDEKNAGS